MENNRYREEEKEQEEIKDQKELESVVIEKSLDDDRNVNHDNEETLKNDDVKNNKSKKEIKKLKKKLEESEKVNEELLQKISALTNEMLKDRAELENFKRRTNEERIRERKYALNDFLLELINVLDIFDRAVSTKTDDEKLAKYLMGFQMVNAQLQQILTKNGVSKIEALNKKFDPLYHSAVETVECENVESGVVVEEIMTGYMYKDRVLRPSMVKVSK